MDIDGLIDAFVRKVNRSPRRRIRKEDIPRQLRKGRAALGIYYDWTIQRFDPISWIEPLEASLPAKLPPSFRSLVARYRFPAFDVPPLILLANTGHRLYHEMRTAMVRDKVVSQVLLKHGYAQFARPITGEADPVCFDFQRQTSDGECPIVRINHQKIIFNSHVQVTEEIAPSFVDIVQQFTQEKIPSPLSKVPLSKSPATKVF